MTEDDNLPMLLRKLLQDSLESISKVPVLVCIARMGQSTKRRQFGVHTGFLYIQVGKSESSPPTKTPLLIAASIERDTTEPWIKRPIDVKRLQ
jgi:hypothetical protein